MKLVRPGLFPRATRPTCSSLERFYSCTGENVPGVVVLGVYICYAELGTPKCKRVSKQGSKSGTGWISKVTVVLGIKFSLSFPPYLLEQCSDYRKLHARWWYRVDNGKTGKTPGIPRPRRS